MMIPVRPMHMPVLNLFGDGGVDEGILGDSIQTVVHAMEGADGWLVRGVYRGV